MYTDPENVPPEEQKGHAHVSSTDTRAGRLHRLLRRGRVEEEGIVPVPVEKRTETRYFSVLTLWASMNANILP